MRVVPPQCSDKVSRAPPPYSSLHIFNTPPTGLSPSSVSLSRLFKLENTKHWPGPRSLATTNGVSVDVLSYRYLDVSVPCVRLLHLCIQCKIPLRVGFPPIQISTDQSLFAAPPHGFSQRTTSFIASCRQGIHQTPLKHLISLIFNVHSRRNNHLKFKMFIQSALKNKSQAGSAVSKKCRLLLRHILRNQSAKMIAICLDQLLEMQSKPRGQANG